MTWTQVNGVKLLTAEIDQSGSRQFYDGDRQLVMSLTCNAHGHLKDLRLPPGFHSIRYNYDGSVSHDFIHDDVLVMMLNMTMIYVKNRFIVSSISFLE